jgi:hypothetical protein
VCDIGPEDEEMRMEQDDLARLKHVGVSRKKLLHEHGVTTIRQLHGMPEENLAAIKSIGGHYARLIKNSAAEHYKESQIPLSAGIESSKERKNEETGREFQENMKRIRNRLTRVQETLRPLGKKKYLPFYIEFRKQLKKLKAVLDETEQIQGKLSRKAKKKIIKKTTGLAEILKKAGRKPGKRNYKKINREILSFTGKLHDVIS